MRQRARIVRVMRGRIGSVRRSAITRACLAGLLGGIFPCAAVADFASITVRSIAIKPGETGRVVLKIDEPGTYRFRCAFHPTFEIGTLTLE